MTLAEMLPNLAMLLALLASALAAETYLREARGPESKHRTLVKTAAVGLLAVPAMWIGAPWLLVAALLLSALGDAFLARDGERRFIAGLTSFLLAHIAYAWLFVERGGLPGSLGTAGMVIIGLLALAVGAMLVRHAGELRLPVAVYALAIAAMGMTSVLLGGWVVFGALMFMASDTLLGLEKFMLDPDSRYRRLTAPAVWILYYCGQVAISYGVVFG